MIPKIKAYFSNPSGAALLFVMIMAVLIVVGIHYIESNASATSKPPITIECHGGYLWAVAYNNHNIVDIEQVWDVRGSDDFPIKCERKENI